MKAPSFHVRTALLGLLILSFFVAAGVVAAGCGSKKKGAVDPTGIRLKFLAAPQQVAANQRMGIPVHVYIVDAAGNTTSVPASVPVTLAIGTNPNGAALTGTLTIASADGDATFTDLTMDKVGSGFTVVATAPGLMPATSAAFDVGPWNLTAAGTGLHHMSLQWPNLWVVSDINGARVSDNGAISFTTRATGLGDPNVTVPWRIAANSTNADILYIAGQSGSDALFKTIDAGVTWNSANTGLSGPFGYSALAIDPEDNSTLLLGTTGAFMTTNGAMNWFAVNGGLGITPPNVHAFAFETGGVVLAATEVGSSGPPIRAPDGRRSPTGSARFPSTRSRSEAVGSTREQRLAASSFLPTAEPPGRRSATHSERARSHRSPWKPVRR